ncbi:hypothetical protein M9Y10_027916 [Tritrichomonas musculus]|uniref:Uncharacterized protein n=1 Tax=Tritrichomonas musculus TaxID=1915356 RepID=A0ABR2H4D5_9EUKA
MKQVRGLKRNKIIQRWIQGIEDPEYEVFPSKKEGKYIVKLRDNKTEKRSVDNIQNDDTQEDPVEINNQETPPLVKQIPHTENIPRRTTSRSIRKNDSISDGNFVPQTINLEILEQLRNFGEELRNDRFKKEQKQYIKHVINKELSKSRIRSKYVPELISEVPQESTPREEESESTCNRDLGTEETVCQTNIAPLVFRSRIRR